MVKSTKDTEHAWHQARLTLPPDKEHQPTRASVHSIIWVRIVQMYWTKEYPNIVVYKWAAYVTDMW